MYQNENVLILKNISKNFGSKKILEDLDLNINEGEVVGIVGSNGSGKTTLLKIIMGLIYPNEGEVIVNGDKVLPGFLGNLPTKIGALIENPTFLPQFSGIKNLSMLASIRNEINDMEIQDVMKKVGLDPVSTMVVNKYSLGMRQRLGIAQAIMENPKLVLFDEPTNGLDSDGIELFSKIIKDMKNEGCSFIIVSHRIDEINNLCDRVYKIESRKLINMKKYVKKENGQ